MSKIEQLNSTATVGEVISWTSGSSARHAIGFR